MQCPGMYDEQKEMHEHLSLIVPEIVEEIAEEPHNSFFWLMGRNVPDISEKCHKDFRCITGKWIYKIYNKAVMNRCRVG